MVAPQAASASSSHIHGDIKTVLFSEKAIADRCIALGKTLAADFADRQPLVVVTLAGACMFASELLKRLEPVPEGLHVDFIRASSYGASTTSSGSVDVQVPLPHAPA
jgi:hypoxanthine phosphoribosyltransferase